MNRRRKPYRRQRGFGLPAAAGLCLACLLLLFSHAGGENTIQSLLAALAQNDGFVTRALALELGLSAGETAVFSPHTAAAALREDAPEPVSESSLIPYDDKADIPVLSAADKAATVTINNETSYEVNTAACLAENTAIHVSGEGPQVLIVHTHGSESYTPDAAFPYTPTETERTTDTRYNVIRVGDELQSVLEQNGVQTVHIRDVFDSPTYSGSYDRALNAINQALAQYPSIVSVIDVHRDSILTDDGTPYKTSCTIDGTEMAQLMFVVGTDDGGLEHPNWRQNLQYAANLQYALNRAYPGLMRPVNLRTQRFNQHATAGSMLIEVGSSGNTMTEALAAVRLFGAALADSMTGT